MEGHGHAQVFGWIGNQKGAPNVLFSSFWPDAANPYTAAHILYAADGGLNYLGCSDPAITALLPKALTSGDPAVYAKIGSLASASDLIKTAVSRDSASSVATRAWLWASSSPS